MFYTLTDLLFICLYSAVLSLSFDDLFTSSLNCTAWTPYSQFNETPAITGTANVEGTLADSTDRSSRFPLHERDSLRRCPRHLPLPDFCEGHESGALIRGVLLLFTPTQLVLTSCLPNSWISTLSSFPPNFPLSYGISFSPRSLSRNRNTPITTTRAVLPSHSFPSRQCRNIELFRILFCVFEEETKAFLASQVAKTLLPRQLSATKAFFCTVQAMY
jgi:hypothetical protein